VSGLKGDEAKGHVSYVKEMKRVSRKPRVGVPLRARGARPMRKNRLTSRISARSRRGTHAALPSARKGQNRAAHASPTTQPVQQTQDAQYVAAIKGFELAVRQFTRQNLEKAKPLFERLTTSNCVEVADRAKLYLRLCQQKLERPAPPPKTAADYYTLGVAELNSRNLESAIQHLTKADKMQPKRDHTRYALAAAYALKGNAEAALEHLKVAIQLRPANMYQARHDEDFQSLASHPVFRSLVRAHLLHATATA
jgi:tetratricopeptide (TPR) repeat protein